MKHVPYKKLSAGLRFTKANKIDIEEYKAVGITPAKQL